MKESVYCTLMPANKQLVIGGIADRLTISTLSKIALFSYNVHCHYQNNDKSILRVLAYSYSNEVAHMIEELFSVF